MQPGDFSFLKYLPLEGVSREARGGRIGYFHTTPALRATPPTLGGEFTTLSSWAICHRHLFGCILR